MNLNPMEQAQQAMREQQKQNFERSENSRLISALKEQNEELVRTLKQYNDMVAKNNQRIEEREKKQDAEMKKLETYKNHIAIAGVLVTVANIFISLGIAFLKK